MLYIYIIYTELRTIRAMYTYILGIVYGEKYGTIYNTVLSRISA